MFETILESGLRRGGEGEGWVREGDEWGAPRARVKVGSTHESSISSRISLIMRAGTVSSTIVKFESTPSSGTSDANFLQGGEIGVQDWVARHVLEASSIHIMLVFSPDVKEAE